MENVYLHSVSWLHWSLGRADCEGEFVHPRWIGKQHCCEGLLTALLLRLGSLKQDYVAVLAGGWLVTPWHFQLLLYDPRGGSKTSKEIASQRLQVHRTTSLVYLLCLCLLCFSSEPHKANKFQVKSELVSVFVWLLTPVHPLAGLSFHICRLHTCVESGELILPTQKRTGAEHGFHKQPMHLYWNQAIKNWAILL